LQQLMAFAMVGRNLHLSRFLLVSTPVLVEFFIVKVV
jgi:hypothetical protein